MDDATRTIDDNALDGLSAAPADDSSVPESGPACDPRQDAGRDESIEARLQRNPHSPEAQLDRGLDESMDASDPPASTQPSSLEPAPSSGYDPDAEGTNGAA